MSSRDDEFSIYLRKPDKKDIDELTKAFDRSQNLHQPWTVIPKDIKRYAGQSHRYLVCHKESNAIVGSFHIGDIVEGWFHSAYIG